MYKAFMFLLGFLTATFRGGGPGLPSDHGLSGNQDANGSQPVATEQVLAFSPGWNWFSCYLECDDAMFTALKGGIAENTGYAVIKDQTNSTMLQSNSWSPSGLNLVNESMYMVSLEESVTVTLNGAMAATASHVIELKPGWNWIGFPSTKSLPVGTALASITPNQGDLIKSMTVTSSYSGGWSGQLKNLEPGVGYMYYNAGTETMFLTFPSSAGGE